MQLLIFSNAFGKVSNLKVFDLNDSRRLHSKIKKTDFKIIIIFFILGVSAGHYTSYSKHVTTNEWYYFNDENAKKEAPNTDECVNEYIFFYQRRLVLFISFFNNLIDFNNESDIIIFFLF